MNITPTEATLEHVFSNFTYLEDDPLDEEELHLDSSNPFSVFIRLLVHCISVLTDLLIVYTICKFQRLKTYEMKLIFHWAISNALFFITARTTFIIFHKFLLHSQVVNLAVISCFMFEAFMSFLFGNFLFAFGLYASWILSNINLGIADRWKSCKLNVIHVLYSLQLLYYFTAIGLCYVRGMFLLNVAYGIILFGTIALSVIKRFFICPNEQALKNAYTTIVASTIIFSFMPLFIYHILIHHVHCLAAMLSCTIIIPEVIAYSSPVAVFYILWEYNDDFGATLGIIIDRIFKRERENEGWTELLVNDVEATGVESDQQKVQTS